MKIEATLRALSDLTRLRIMRLLAHMELAVGELVQVLGQSQPRVSRHVRILCDAGLTERRKEGSWVFLRIAIGENLAPPLGNAAARLLAIAEGEDSMFAARCAEDRRHLAAIRADRSAKAEAWFSRHAEEWDTLRLLHCPDEPVEAALAEALGIGGGDALLGNLLDVGTGTGRMAELFAPHAAHVTALDRSPEMLQVARARLQDSPAGLVDLVQGDFAMLPFGEGAFDTVLFHQVLHYARDPGAALAEAARVIAPGGTIALVDFASHDREELRERHAHARLGFSDEQMLALLTEAGFACRPPVALSGTPLTVKIWMARKQAGTAPTTKPAKQARAVRP